MAVTFEQLGRQGIQRVSAFERVFRVTLASLLPDLAETPYHVREHEVVNLFVFAHLIPAFQSEGLDIRQISIEISIGSMSGRYADIAIWPHEKATVWRTCMPLAVIEWKNISCRATHQDATTLLRAHQGDIDFLRKNASRTSVGYAVLTRQMDLRVELQCTKVLTDASTDLFPEPLRCHANYQENERKPLLGPLRDVRHRKRDCPRCGSN
jgi:hypothetical protein